METLYTSEDYNKADANLANIIAMNTSDDDDDETQEYSLNCDLNDLYKFERFVSYEIV